MGADKISIQEFSLWTRFHSCTSASFSCQVHAATKVLLNLGARPNQQPQHTRSGNTHETATGSPKPVRPVSETGQTASVGLSLKQAGETGQTGLANRSDQLCPETPQRPKTPQEPFHIWTKEAIAQQRLPCSKNPSRQPTGRKRSDRFGKPVRPVSAWTVGKNTARGKNSTLPPIDLPICSTDQSETLRIVRVPRGLPLARSSGPKTHSIKRNRKSTLKNTSNPRTSKTPKSSPLTRGFGRGIKGKRTTKGSHKFPPSNPQEQGLENTPRKPPRESSENHHQEQPGTTQQSLEEPRRIIYTYQGGSYKV
jgi:hypothetical protein